MIRIDENKNFTGVISVAEAHAPDLDEENPRSLESFTFILGTVLLPDAVTAVEVGALLLVERQFEGQDLLAAGLI